MNILALGLLLMQVRLGAVGGTVTKPGGTEPLPKATVILSPIEQGQNARLRSAVTEEDGRFSLQNIEPVDYRLTVQNERYGQAAYGQRKPGGPGAILSIADGQQLSDLRISMVPTGAIAGRITGSSGEPLVNATVQAFKYAYENGKKVLVPAQVATTDDRGEYRLFWLPAGQYFVAAATGNAARLTPAAPSSPGSNLQTNEIFLRDAQEFSLVQEIIGITTREFGISGNTRLRILEDGTTQEEAWAPVYYPATAEARLAAPLDVAPGTTRAGIDIVLSPARIQSIRGRVVGFTPGSVPTVSLFPQDSSAPRPLNKGGSTTDGSFAFTGVLPGDYYVVARDPRAGLAGLPVSVHVGAGDVENLTVSVGQAVTLNGRVRVEGTTDAPRAGVILQPTIDGVAVPSSLLTQFSAAFDPVTGSFVVNNLSPGDYQINITSISSQGGPSAKPLYVKSARLGTTDVFGGLRIDANTRDSLDIVLAAAAGSVEGVAIGSRSAPAVNVTVVLVPNLARKRSELYKTIMTGPDGRFRFQNIAPGDYKLFAWEDVETGAWQDPDFMRVHEAKGLLVRIGEKSKEDVQLNVIYNP